MLDTGKFTTCAFYQADFGTAYLKPTRLLLKNVNMHDSMKEGMPVFEDQGFDQGPLERRSMEVRLIGQQNGKFSTAGTEQWPSDFCRWVAVQVLTTWSSIHSITVCGGGPNNSNAVDKGQSGEETYPISQPVGWKIQGGRGEAGKCEVPGKSRAFHDGCGLASPGRWEDPDKRIWNDDNFWRDLRKRSYSMVLQHCGGRCNFDRICFEMAAKGEALLDRAGDPDQKFLLQGEKGYPVGVIHPLPQTPHMYEEQTSWKFEGGPYMKSAIWRETNYESVGDHENFVREHLLKNVPKV
eukprot:s1612_g13.t1